MAGLGKKVVGSILALSLLTGMVVFGGVIYVGVAIACGVTALSPVNAAEGALNGIKAGVSDTFFNLFATEDSKKRKALAIQIVQIGQERKFTEQSITIAVATALKSSKLQNVPYSLDNNDPTRMGIYQVSPSKEWGNAEQIMDSSYAINKFYDHLQVISNRDSLKMVNIAIEIEMPSDKAAYAKNWTWDAIAVNIVAQNYKGKTENGSSCTSANSEGWRLPLNKHTYTIGDSYGLRFHPIYFVWKLHTGQDLPAVKGTPIYAVHDGKVTRAGINGDLGNYVQIDHGGGISTGYGHMSLIANGITAGTEVRAGQVIGYVGETGGATGNHLHFMVLVNGKTTNPMPFMLKLGVDIKANAR